MRRVGLGSAAWPAPVPTRRSWRRRGCEHGAETSTSSPSPRGGSVQWRAQWVVRVGPRLPKILAQKFFRASKDCPKLAQTLTQPNNSSPLHQSISLSRSAQTLPVPDSRSFPSPRPRPCAPPPPAPSARRPPPPAVRHSVPDPRPPVSSRRRRPLVSSRRRRAWPAPRPLPRPVLISFPSLSPRQAVSRPSPTCRSPGRRRIPNPSRVERPEMLPDLAHAPDSC